MGGMLERYFAARLAGLGTAATHEVEVFAYEAELVVAVSEVLGQPESSRLKPDLAFDLGWRTW